MEYLTAKETAEQWNVSDRQVSRLIAEGRVLGAKKFGVSWMIPADAEKPRDPRKARTQTVASPYLACVLLSAVTPMPLNNPNAALAAMPDEAQRAQYRAELAYLRGEYEAVKAYYRGVSTADATYLCAANITVCAAMCTRDYPLFKEISASVLQIEEHTPSADARRAASLLPTLAAVCMNAPRLAPDWLMKGEFDGFPAEARPMPVFMRIKYLYSIKDFADVLAAAQTARAIYRRDDAVTLVDLYLTCFCACGSYPPGRLDDTRAYLDQSAALCEKGGFVSPLGEYAPCVGGLLSTALQKATPSFRRAVIKKKPAALAKSMPNCAIMLPLTHKQELFWETRRGTMVFNDFHFYSKVLDLQTTAYVLMPELYVMEEHQNEPLPTLYLLHGLSDNHTMWMRNTRIEQYARKHYMAVVMPEGWRSFYSDMKHGLDYGTFIAEELPKVMETYLPLRTDRDGRFAAGLSMGGFGAMKLGLKYPERYSHVAALSAPMLLEETFDEPWEDERFMREVGNIFGSPEEIRDSDANLRAMAETIAPEDAPRIFAAVGTEDFTYPTNETFMEQYGDKLGVEYHTEAGDHNWDFWDKWIREVLDWLPTEPLDNVW